MQFIVSAGTSAPGQIPFDVAPSKAASHSSRVLDPSVRSFLARKWNPPAVTKTDAVMRGDACP
jgi:hypothetical protein